MISAVLFDMDGTLLDIDIEDFLRAYFRILGPVIAGVLGAEEPSAGLQAVIGGTEAMAAPHPGATNREAFNARFLELTGADLTAPAADQAITTFYREVFPGLRADHGPRTGAQAAVDTAASLGLKLALATNPIFPRQAIVERLSWAGFSSDDFDVVTSYEEMRACKPSHDYFLQVAEMLDVAPAECVMVGDDALLDLAAADIGMRTFYVGPASSTSAHWSGSLDDLASLLPKIAGRS